MKRTLLSLTLAALIAGGALTSTAGASGPAAPGKNTFEVECEGIGAFTVSVPASEHGKGAGQAVGEHLHGISTSSTFTVTDVTKGTSLLSETESKGGGNANHNQSTTTCTGTAFEAEAAQFFEGELPEGVSPSDLIRAEFEVQIVPKP